MLNIFFLSLGKIDKFSAFLLISLDRVILQAPTTPHFNPKRPRLLGGVLFGEMKFVLSNFLSNEDLSISYES